MSKLFARTIFLAAILAALLAVLPAAAGPAPQPPSAATPAVSPLAPSCNLGALVPAVSTPALPEWLAIDGSPSVKYHGYCPCGCSTIKNCNTDADCGGSPCRPNFSCC